MRKYLALLLIMALSLTALLGLAPMASAAEEEAVTPSQDIIYFNVSIKVGARLLFAVPADGYTVNPDGTVDNLQALVWEEGASNGVYSKSDAEENGAVLEAQGKQTIGGKEFIVFSYTGLDASQMSETVYIRTLVTENGLPSYGDIYDYSIAEFANTYLNRDDAEYKKLVKSLVDYGYHAALYKDKTSYTSEEVVELGKVNVTAMIDGIELFTQTTQLAKVGETFTLVAPHVDGADFIGWSGDVADGKITMTGDEVSVVANYRPTTYFDADADYYGAGVNLNTLDKNDSTVGTSGKVSINSSGISYYLGNPDHAKSRLTLNFSAAATTYGSEKADGSSKNWRRYHGIKTVADPEDPDKFVFQFTNTDYGGYQFTLKNIGNTGFGDTVSPVINYSFKIGSINGRIGSMGTFYHRLRFYDATSGSKVADLDTQFFRITNGVIQTMQNGSWKNSITIPTDDKMHQYVLSVDTRNLTFAMYAEDASGNLYKATDDIAIKHANTITQYYNDGKYNLGSFENFFLGNFGSATKSNFESSFTWTGASNWGNGDSATVMYDGDGDGTPEEHPVLKGYVQNEKSYWALVDGKLVQYSSSKHTADQRVSPEYDLEAVRIYAEANCGVLLDELKITIGNVYGR